MAGAGVLAALLGVVLGYRLSSRQEAATFQRNRTHAFIDEFHSAKFIEHRDALWLTQQAVRNGDATIERIARGFVHPITGDWYLGEVHFGLSEHDHLGVFFGFMVRLDMSIRSGTVCVREIRDSLAYENRWHAGLVREVSRRAIELSRRSGSVEPSFASCVLNVLNKLGLDKGFDEGLGSATRSED